MAAQIGIPVVAVGGVALIAYKGRGSTTTSTVAGPGVSAGAPSVDSGGGAGGTPTTVYIPTGGPGGGGTTGASSPGATIPGGGQTSSYAPPSGGGGVAQPLAPIPVSQGYYGGQYGTFYGFSQLPSTFQEFSGGAPLPDVYAPSSAPSLPATKDVGGTTEYLTKVGGPSTGYAYTYSATPPAGTAVQQEAGTTSSSQPGPTHTGVTAASQVKLYEEYQTNVQAGKTAAAATDLATYQRQQKLLA